MFILALFFYFYFLFFFYAYFFEILDHPYFFPDLSPKIKGAVSHSYFKIFATFPAKKLIVAFSRFGKKSGSVAAKSYQPISTKISGIVLEVRGLDSFKHFLQNCLPSLWGGPQKYLPFLQNFVSNYLGQLQTNLNEIFRN